MPKKQNADKKKFRITFRGEIYVSASSREEAEAKFGGIPLFSASALHHNADYVETVSVEEQ